MGDPRIDLIRELSAAGVPEADMQGYLDRFDAEGGVSPYEQSVGEQSGTTPRTRMEVAAHAAREKEGFKQMGKGIAGAAIVGGSAYLGGLPLAAMAPEGYGVLAGIAGQTAGAYGGELARQGVMGEKLSQRKAREAAIWTGVPGVVGYGATKALGAAGGVSPAASEYVGMRSKVVPRFDLTMREPPSTAELNLGRKVTGAVEKQARPLTPGRIAESGYIKKATAQGTLIDPEPIVQQLKGRMLKTPKTAAGRNLNRRLQELVDSLDETQSRGGVTPDELDELLGSELDPAIYSGGKASGRMASKRLVPAREAGRESLMGALPPEASEARTAAAQELSRRELAGTYFTGSEKKVTNQIRSLFQPGNEGALESLREVGKREGINFEQMAQEIMVKRSFNADDRIKAGMLHRIMLSLGVVGMATGRPGYMAAGILSQPSVARFGAKMLAPTQMLLGPAGALMSQVYKGQYPMGREGPKVSPHSEQQPTMWEETKVTPEQLYPGMTNAEPK